MSRTLKHDIPGPDWRLAPAEVAEKGWPAVFERGPESCLPLVVEIGFGRGEFLSVLAQARPTQAFVGIEVSHKRVLKMARRLARSELRNVRLLEARAEDVVSELLAERSVREFWVNFPDPWPKKRHASRRFFRPEVASLLTSRMVPGGVLHAATDDPVYAAQIDRVLAGQPGLDNLYTPAPFRRERPGPVETAYERQWREEGRRLHFFAYRRSS